jgi:phosphoglycerol transferase
MSEKTVDRLRLREFGLYAIVCSLSLLIAFPVLKLNRADWRVPFIYTGDAVFYSTIIKSIRENGWYLHHDSIGMPWGTDLHDFPVPDNFHLLLIKFATFLTADHALILNLFFLLTFPLAALAAFFVFRRFEVSFFPALLGSLLYSFTPYHLSRSENHLMYSAYYAVPLMVMVILWVCAKESEVASRDLSLSLRNRKFLFSLGVCVLIASTGGVYYAFFACYLLLVVGLIYAADRRSIRRLLLPGALIATISVTLLANLSPSIVYRMRHGKVETPNRVASEAETYGLKIAQLLLPLTGHRIPALAQLKDRYNYNPLITENDDATLGVIGSVGFLTLLGWLLAGGLNLRRSNRDAAGQMLSRLSVLNISSFLLGTIGGLSSIFALLVSPLIRAYNRISVYISFFALFAIVLLLDRVRQKYFRNRNGEIIFGFLSAILIIVGVLDQSSNRFVPNYGWVQPSYRSDADFVGKLEASVPRGAMIFQLPLMRFPESEPIERVWGYDPLKGYLHSKHLRWSYGAMRDRQSDIWQMSIAEKPLPEMVAAAALAGFDGIYVDRFGYADDGARLEGELTALTETKPLVSNNERLSFFTLAAYREKLQKQFTAEQLAARREETLYPIMTKWGSGFSDSEGSADDQWRWCGPAGEMILWNLAQGPRRVRMEMAFSSDNEGILRIESRFFSEQLRTRPEPLPFSKTIELPHGKHSFKFSSDAKRVNAPNDPRFLVFRVNNFKLRSTE